MRTAHCVHDEGHIKVAPATPQSSISLFMQGRKHVSVVSGHGHSS